MQRSRLRIESRQWLMEEFAPERFGPRSKVEVTTRDAELERLSELSDEQRLAEAKELIETARRRLAMAEWPGQLGDGCVTDVPSDEDTPQGGIG